MQFDRQIDCGGSIFRQFLIQAGSAKCLLMAGCAKAGRPHREPLDSAGRYRGYPRQGFAGFATIRLLLHLIQ